MPGRDTARTAYRVMARAVRRERSSHLANRFYGAVVAPTTAPPPAIQLPDPLDGLQARRDTLLADLRKTRAELSRRQSERDEYARLGLDAPSYIVTDRALNERMSSARWLHLRTVRGAYLPLTVLVFCEGTASLMRLFGEAA